MQTTVTHRIAPKPGKLTQDTRGDDTYEGHGHSRDGLPLLLEEAVPCPTRKVLLQCEVITVTQAKEGLLPFLE